MTRDRVIKAARRSARRGNRPGRAHPSAHVLFAPGDEGRPARAVEELGGHADLSTTQRYMHLILQRRKTRSDCWTDESPGSNRSRVLETFWTRGGNALKGPRE